jgi:hypothetical protein
VANFSKAVFDGSLSALQQIEPDVHNLAHMADARMSSLPGPNRALPVRAHQLKPENSSGFFFQARSFEEEVSRLIDGADVAPLLRAGRHSSRGVFNARYLRSTDRDGKASFRSCRFHQERSNWESGLGSWPPS